MDVDDDPALLVQHVASVAKLPSPTTESVVKRFTEAVHQLESPEVHTSPQLSNPTVCTPASQVPAELTERLSQLRTLHAQNLLPQNVYEQACVDVLKEFSVLK